MTRKKWIGHTRLLAEVLIVQVYNIVKCIKLQEELDPRGFLGPLVLGPWSPGLLFLPTYLYVRTSSKPNYRRQT